MEGRARLYLALAAIGLIAQLAITGVFLADTGLDLGEFADQAVESTIAVLTLADLVMCAVVYFVWSHGEARRLGMRPWWPFAVATLGGVCFAFPLFLAYRERALAPSGASP